MDHGACRDVRRRQHGPPMWLSTRRRRARAGLCATRTVALRRCFAALAFVAAFVALCIAAAAAAANSVIAGVLGACCAITTGAVVTLELVPAVAILRSGAANAVQRRAMRCLRSQLDALPEAAHPLDPSRGHTRTFGAPSTSVDLPDPGGPLRRRRRRAARHTQAADVSNGVSNRPEIADG